MGTPAADILSRAAVLLPIARIALARRADEDDAGPLAGLGQSGVLAQEAVARVDGVAAGPLGDVDDLVDAQVALARGRRADGVRLVGHAHVERRAIGVGVDGDGADAHLAQRAGDADGDLAAVGDEDLAKKTAHLVRPVLTPRTPETKAGAEVLHTRGG